MRPTRTGLEWLTRLAAALRRRGIDFECGTEGARAYLEFRGGGEAVTISGEGGATLLFRDTSPTVSAVLEEVAHAWQARLGSYEEEDARIMSRLREIEAKECLADRRDRLGIPRPEHDQTLGQLAEEREMLESLRMRWR